MILVDYHQMCTVFREILLQEGLSSHRASLCATILADNTLDGVASHGVNRFGQFVEKIRNGQMDKEAAPTKITAFAAFEQWDGNSGIGPLNALAMMDRAMELSDEYGLGMVALRNTTHWMRGATYGYHAVSRGYPCICWTNTMANMTPWQSSTESIGNNPIVIGMPGKKTQAVLDMALSQYSYGTLQTINSFHELLPFDGGFDRAGNLTRDPGALLQSRRVLPIGLWKGSGLSILGDLLVSVLSHGTSTLDMPTQGSNPCQIFLAIHPARSEDEMEWQRTYTDHVLAELKRICRDNGEEVSYPGEGTATRRAKNMRHGIPVQEEIWESILGSL